jgi:hypothetical protein
VQTTSLLAKKSTCLMHVREAVLYPAMFWSTVIIFAIAEMLKAGICHQWSLYECSLKCLNVILKAILRIKLVWTTESDLACVITSLYAVSAIQSQI